jgi:hypothetical protein
LHTGESIAEGIGMPARFVKATRAVGRDRKT